MEKVNPKHTGDVSGHYEMKYLVDKADVYQIENKPKLPESISTSVLV